MPARDIAVDFVPALVLLLLGSFSSEMYGSPHERFFLEADPRYSFPNMESTVGTAGLIVISLVIPLVFAVGLPYVAARVVPEAASGSPGKGASRCVAALFVTLAVTEFLTNIIKAYVGELRPDFFAVCGYPKAEDGQYGTPGVQGSLANCADYDDEAELDYLRSSFPSGHSSLSMAGMGFVALALYTVLVAAAPKPEFRPAVVFVVMWPLFLALFVAASRVRDYKHHAHDVVAGAALGGAVAVSVFNAYFGGRAQDLVGAGAGGKLAEPLM